MSFFQIIDEQEKKWREIVDLRVGPDARLISRSCSSPQRRVYSKNKTIFKIILSHDNIYEISSSEEYNILKQIEHIDCVPKPIACVSYENCAILLTEEYFGESIGQSKDIISKDKVSFFAVVKSFLQLNRHGLRHGDIHIDNVLFLPNGALKILDYDQALFTTKFYAFLGDFFGVGKFPAKRCAIKFLCQILFLKLPSYLRPKLNIGAFMRRRRFKKTKNKTELSEKGSELQSIWNKAMLSDANAPSHRICYYSLVYDGKIYQGERAWETRWNAIRNIVDFRGKRVLELGCNLGLLSCYAQHAGALSGGIAIDRDHKIIEAAKRFAELTEVDVNFYAIDFDGKTEWERELPINDLHFVCALSVLNWLKNQSRFLSFLKNFTELLYEGHDSISIEASRLNSIGFMKLSLITVSERGRVIIYAKK